MKASEIDKRLSILESKRSGKFESTIILELPEKAYQPLYPAQPAARRLYREIPDASE